MKAPIERKLLIKTEEYSIGEDGMIDSKVPLTNICYELALQLQKAKTELEQYKKSKQASYESMQIEWNKVVNELRDIKSENKIEFKQYYKLENEKLKTENEELNNKIEKIKSRFSSTKKANKQYKKEIEELKHWLENKEKAYNHLCNSNNRKKEQIKNLNYMLFEEKEMSTQEWKLKYKLANKERKFIQYKDIVSKKLQDYCKTLDEIKEIVNTECKKCPDGTYREDYCIGLAYCTLAKINEVFNQREDK